MIGQSSARRTSRQSDDPADPEHIVLGFRQGDINTAVNLKRWRLRQINCNDARDIIEKTRASLRRSPSPTNY